VFNILAIVHSLAAGARQRRFKGLPAGQKISARPFQLVTGRVWKATAFRGAKGRTDVPKIVDWYMEQKINIDDLTTHKLPLQDISKGFDLMRAGESIRSVVVY
jgi:S-(hydroxymethyl)glutathione dehydrogenase / alcohol dehydrogenase